MHEQNACTSAAARGRGGARLRPVAIDGLADEIHLGQAQDARGGKLVARRAHPAQGLAGQQDEASLVRELEPVHSVLLRLREPQPCTSRGITDVVNIAVLYQSEGSSERGAVAQDA